MISESINTQRTLEKNLGQPRWPKSEAEKRGVWPGSENTSLLMIDYHKEPIATGSIIKGCIF